MSLPPRVPQPTAQVAAIPAMTPFVAPEELARRVGRDELLRLGAQPGCAVTIGDMTFDWEPQTPAGVQVPLTGRGTDARLERTERVGADERKAARRRRREHGDDS